MISTSPPQSRGTKLFFCCLSGAIGLAAVLLISNKSLAQLPTQTKNQIASTETAELEGKAISVNRLEKKVWDINDSLMSLPAYDLYCDWNVKKVHPFRVDLTKKADTTLLPLIKSGSCDYALPSPGHVTSDFGHRRYRYHYGIDIKLQTGDTVRSVFEGTVRVAHYDASYGKVVVVRHTNGLETLYAHLSKLSVEPGDWVEAGDLVGLGGNTGRSTGSHLHFECRYLGEPINPNELIDFAKGSLKTDTLALTAGTFHYLKALRTQKFHTIRPGDTLSGLARRYGTSVSTLCRLNRIRSTSTLRVGQRLRYN